MIENKWAMKIEDILCAGSGPVGVLYPFVIVSPNGLLDLVHGIMSRIRIVMNL